MATQPSLKARAIDLLSRREHSRIELERKLLRYIQPEQHSQLAAVLDELEQGNWLSDERFAQSLVHRRAAKKGVAFIEQELRQHGIDPEHISQISQSLRDTEFDRCLSVWQGRFGASITGTEQTDTESAPVKQLDPKEYARQYRFLGSRGFAPDCIRRVLETAKGPR